METVVGKVYGELTVLSQYRSEKGYWRCRCRCSCGQTTDVIYANLKTGRTKSCGHLERANRQKYSDLTGQVFGELTVLEKTDKRAQGVIVWRCQCSCGRILEVSRRQLLRGYKTSCGFHQEEQLLGRRFNELTVLAVSDDHRRLLCRCSCGRETWIARGNVLNGHTKSCGHLKKQDNRERIDGVLVSALHKKISARNTSGYTGVSCNCRKRWVAYITFKGKRYTLGEFAELTEAVSARIKAEAQYFKPILDKKKAREI